MERFGKVGPPLKPVRYDSICQVFGETQLGNLFSFQFNLFDERMLTC